MRKELHLRALFVMYIKLLSTRIWQIKNQLHYVKQIQYALVFSKSKEQKTQHCK